jgi:hypothetical protein
MDAAGLPPLNIHNSTDHRCEGLVVYDDGLEEPFLLLGWGDWTGNPERGRRLVSRITAKVRRSTGLQTDAAPFVSSGSDADQFAILRRSGDFLVSRIDSGEEGE